MFAGHPDVHCTFNVISQCDRWFGHNTDDGEECRRGSRDAHLLHDGVFGNSAYNLGKWTTLRECAPIMTHQILPMVPRFTAPPLLVAPTCSTCGYW